MKLTLTQGKIMKKRFYFWIIVAVFLYENSIFELL